MPGNLNSSLSYLITTVRIQNWLLGCCGQDTSPVVLAKYGIVNAKLQNNERLFSCENVLTTTTTATTTSTTGSTT